MLKRNTVTLVVQLRIILSAAAFGLSTAALAGAPCPPREAGSLHPWQIRGYLPGDKYAWIHIEIDEKGRPLKCAVGKTNVLGDDKFWLCKAFNDDWSTEPIVENGVAKRGWVKRFLTLPGDKHEKLDREARKRWFAEHPSERPECYPE